MTSQFRGRVREPEGSRLRLVAPPSSHGGAAAQNTSDATCRRHTPARVGLEGAATEEEAATARRQEGRQARSATKPMPQHALTSDAARRRRATTTRCCPGAWAAATRCLSATMCGRGTPRVPPPRGRAEAVHRVVPFRGGGCHHRQAGWSVCGCLCDGVVGMVCGRVVMTVL